MPISVENKSLYPKNWKEISQRIRFERAGGKCEKCGVANYDTGWRDREGNFHPSAKIIDAMEDEGYDYFQNELSHIPMDQGPIKIILTTAHLNHDPTDNRDENLAAWCQRCHLAHDSTHHRTNARKTRTKHQYQLF